MSTIGAVSAGREIPGKPGLQELHERRVHELELVGYVETDQSFAAKGRTKPFLHLGAVRLLHDDDYVGPRHQFGGEGVFGVVVRPSRGHFKVRPRREDLLSGWTSQAVLTAHE